MRFTYLRLFSINHLVLCVVVICDQNVSKKEKKVLRCFALYNWFFGVSFNDGGRKGRFCFVCKLERMGERKGGVGVITWFLTNYGRRIAQQTRWVL